MLTVALPIPFTGVMLGLLRLMLGWGYEPGTVVLTAMCRLTVLENPF